jgi:hypothetical protein
MPSWGKRFTRHRIGQEALSRIAGSDAVRDDDRADSYIEDRKIGQAKAASNMGVSQPRISDPMDGKIGTFTLDTLVDMSTSAGLKVDLRIRPGRPKGRKFA